MAEGVNGNKKGVWLFVEGMQQQSRMVHLRKEIVYCATLLILWMNTITLWNIQFLSRKGKIYTNISTADTCVSLVNFQEVKYSIIKK